MYLAAVMPVNKGVELFNIFKEFIGYTFKFFNDSQFCSLSTALKIIK